MRDAGEAQRHRIDALERELADARRDHAELEALSGRATEIERERARLDLEVTTLRTEAERARATRGRWIAGSGAIALIAIAGAWMWASVEHRAMTARSSADQAELDAAMRAAQSAADRQVGELAVQAHEAEERERTAEERVRLAEQRERLAQERADELGDQVDALASVTPGAHLFAPWSSVGRVVRAEGREVPGPCEISMRAERLQCHARVVCGTEELYPHPGTSGRVPRCVSDARGFRSATDGETTERDGDPVLELDVEAGTAVVADRAWRVELTLDR